MFSSVTLAMLRTASRVKNAWCEVTSTFGKESSRASTSSMIGPFERSSKK